MSQTSKDYMPGDCTLLTLAASHIQAVSFTLKILHHPPPQGGSPPELLHYSMSWALATPWAVLPYPLEAKTSGGGGAR